MSFKVEAVEVKVKAGASMYLSAGKWYTALRKTAGGDGIIYLLYDRDGDRCQLPPASIKEVRPYQGGGAWESL